MSVRNEIPLRFGTLFSSSFKPQDYHLRLTWSYENENWESFYTIISENTGLSAVCGCKAEKLRFVTLSVSCALFVVGWWGICLRQGTLCRCISLLIKRVSLIKWIISVMTFTVKDFMFQKSCSGHGDSEFEGHYFHKRL